MANPVLNEKFFQSGLNSEIENKMTINGTILKSCFLGILTAITFSYNWALLLAGYVDKAKSLSTFGFWGAIILCLIICFGPKNKFLMFTTSLYALCEGLILGFLSALVNSVYPGIASQAAIGTIFALFSMFILYKANIIKNTDRFRKVIFTATFAVFGIYMLQIILKLFHLSIPAIFSSSPIGIGFSVLVIAIATLNLIIDFDMIESLSGKVDKPFEWYFGFSLMVTLIWIYLEILNLLIKLQNRSR